MVWIHQRHHLGPPGWWNQIYQQIWCLEVRIISYLFMLLSGPILHNSISCNFWCIIFTHFYDFTGIWFPSRICSVQLKTLASFLSMGSNIWPQGKWLRKISSSMWNMIPWFGSIWTAPSIWPRIWKRNCKSFTPRSPTNFTERGMVLLTYYQTNFFTL